MKNLAIRSTCILTLVIAATAFAQVQTTTVAIMKDGKKFDKKEVVVKGKVEDYKRKTSRKGSKYTSFKVSDGGKFLNVYMKDHLPKDLKDGQMVEVRGIFKVEKKVGTMIFKNEIEISAVKGKKYGVKVLPAVVKK